MDNDNSFQQQFVQNVKTTTVEASTQKSSAQFLPLVIAAILGVIVIIQSIALIMIGSNLSSLFNDDVPEDTTESIDNTDVADPYIYNENKELVAITSTCKADDGSSLALTKTNTFEEYDSNNSLIGSGTYKITRDSVFNFQKSSGDRTLFFDGFTLTDGTTFYNCEEIADDTSRE